MNDSIPFERRSLSIVRLAHNYINSYIIFWKECFVAYPPPSKPTSLPSFHSPTIIKQKQETYTAGYVASDYQATLNSPNYLFTQARRARPSSILRVGAFGGKVIVVVVTPFRGLR